MGIKTGLNEAFVIDESKRNELIKDDPKCEKVIKPFLRGKDVKRWKAKSANLYIIFAKRGFPVEDYPSIRLHLEQYRSALSSRATIDSHPCYELQQPQEGIFHYFEQPKIVIPVIANDAEFAADFSGSYSNDKTSICVTNSIHYLIGILNSKLTLWFIKQIAASKQGGFYEFKPMYVKKLPIAPASTIQQQTIESLVEKVLAAKQHDSASDVSQWEQEIDTIVYQLYQLTDAEIAIVRGEK